MNFRKINPYVRYVEKIGGQACITDEVKASYDHVMVYVGNGSGKIIINELPHSLERGCILILRPGSFYTLTDQEQLELIWIHFDYDSNHSVEKAFYLKPDAVENFQALKMIDDFPVTEGSYFHTTVYCRGFHNMDAYFEDILSEFKRREKYFDFHLSCALSLILIEISRRMKMPKSTETGETDDITNEVISFIHENYNRNITNETIAKKFNFPTKYINMLVKNKTGYPTHKYIVMRRVSKAIDLLQNSDMRIYEIAEKVGFADVCHFSKCFKQMMGKSPRSFRGEDTDSQ